jgi:FecR protein
MLGKSVLGYASTWEGKMRARIIVVFVTVLVAASSFIPGPARAQTTPAVQADTAKAIGKVATVIGSVTIEHVNAVVVQANVASQPEQTKVGDSVYLGDVVQTGGDGKISITFTDDTAFNLSSNARMALNDFVYDPNGKSNSTFFSLTKGTFTFVAGKVAKTGNMKIDTPVATMGIRGTTPHVEIGDDGTVKFSTLIEEGKSKVSEKLAAPVVQKHEQKPNIDICRGC